MKIGFFTDTYFPQINGVTYTVNLWKEQLEKLGHEVIIYYPEDEDYEPKENEISLPSFPFMFYQGYNLGLPLPKKVDQNLDIVHLHGFATMALFGMAVSRKQKIPCVMTYHTPPDMYLQQISSNELIMEALKVAYFKYEKQLLKRCSLITAPSQTMIDLLKHRLGKYISKTMVLSNGIDADFFNKVPSDKFKKDYSIPEGKVIGFAGRHSTEKHLEDLITLADSFDGSIIIAGSGQQHEKYKKMAKGKKNVKFLGFLPRERLPEFYSSLDLLILPSTAETEGLVVLEANACGAPAVGARALALKDTIQDGTNGYLYEPGDVQDLKSKVDKSYSTLESLKTSSTSYAKERSVKNTVNTLIKTYKDLKQ